MTTECVCVVLRNGNNHNHRWDPVCVCVCGGESELRPGEKLKNKKNIVEKYTHTHT